jgi:hypothetical protein
MPTLVPVRPMPVSPVVVPLAGVVAIRSQPTLRQPSRPPAKLVKAPQVKVSQVKAWTVPPHTSWAPKLVPP